MSEPRSMPLGALTDVIAPERVVGLPVGEVRALAYDSRAVQPGTLFFAVPGVHVDGHDFIGQAVSGGALAVVTERELPDPGVPQLVVHRSRDALADASAAWFDHPSRRLHVIGVTGTDGKTTTSFLAAAVLAAAGRRPGMVGTVEVGIGDQRMPNENRNTTPEALELQGLLADMVAAGNDAVVMEATSHGLAQARTRGVAFDVGVLTNLTSEHLEFHGSWENYRAAKALLFQQTPISILNADEPSIAYFHAAAADRVVTYGLDHEADVRASAIDARSNGTAFLVETADWSGRVDLQLPGSFNVHNALAVMALASAEEIDLSLAARALGEVPGVPGRMETVDEGQPFGVVVDYAHTADSLGKVLRVLRPLARGRVIAVFGSAGERDPTKRPAMGRVSAELADITIVTDEDPRLEDPRLINEAIAEGARSAGAIDGDTLFVIDDRTAAIRHAIGLAWNGDVVLLAGKGHEKTIIYGTEGRWWDEKEWARRALRDAGYGDTDAELRAWRVSDREAWNAFVESAPYGSFPQLWEWGELRQASGWSPLRIAVGDDPQRPPAAVAQVLLRRVPAVGWKLAYVPRGPVGHLDDPHTRESMVAALRSLARTDGVATVKVDPETTPDSPFGEALLAPPWRAADKVQPPRTRLIDLAPPAEELRAAMKKKHRQYVAKAEREGMTVEWFDGSADAAAALDDFYRIYAHTAERAGFVARAREYYDRVWSMFAPTGHVSLAFATRDGERLATLFHFTIGDRAAEAFGGMTDAGADARANYLLKWASITGFKERGFAIYDMWGLATGGIAHFKEGFGGRQVDYVGARDLPLRPAEDTALRLLLPAYGIAQRARLRLSGRRLAGSDD